jgi:hypothetical protein
MVTLVRLYNPQFYSRILEHVAFYPGAAGSDADERQVIVNGIGDTRAFNLLLNDANFLVCRLTITGIAMPLYAHRTIVRQGGALQCRCSIFASARHVPSPIGT